MLLNVAHAFDHMFLLIFATAVATIAADFGFARWEDLMPYGVGAFAMFGLCSLPAGRLGDLWGRRRMMLVFFFGMGIATLLVALARSAWQLGAALTVLGVFAAIYHPVGIPMLVQRSTRPGLTIGVNGLAGNMGVALSAVVTGALLKYAGWHVAFVVPALASLACGVLFALVAPHEAVAPARRAATRVMLDKRSLAHIFAVVTIASVSGSLLFNFTTNGNGELLRERLRGIVDDPAALGALLALVYVAGAFTQLGVGLLLDRVSLKKLYGWIVAAQAPLFVLAARADGWLLYALMVLFMVVGVRRDSIHRRDDRPLCRRPDALSRVGMRLAVAFGVSSLAVWLLGPLVKAAGFQTLLLTMAAIAFVTFCVVMLLPQTSERGLGGAAVDAAPRGSD